MKRLMVILAIVSQIASAKVITATYEVSYGIFEAMGIADARFEIKEDQTYTIRIEARTTGVAKILSNNRVEIYESHGKIALFMSSEGTKKRVESISIFPETRS
jgi:hypothetical protein